MLELEVDCESSFCDGTGLGLRMFPISSNGRLAADTLLFRPRDANFPDAENVGGIEVERTSTG